MKILVSLILAMPLYCTGQIFTEASFVSRLKDGDAISEAVLSKRSVVLHSYLLTAKEISATQENFVRTGIDAIAYFKIDEVLAGSDVTQSFAEYFIKREVSNLIVIQKLSSGYTIYITSFNGKEDLVNPNQGSWSTRSTSFGDALNTVYRSALASNKKKNLLINEIPETDLPVRIIDGQRSETFAYDLKVDNLAVMKFGNELLDKELEEILKLYPFRYKLVDQVGPEKDLRSQGFHYILCVVQTRSITARELLDYSVSKSESAFVSVIYPDGQVQLKTIPADTPVFKFYARHLDSGNVFLGTKWDADTTWQQALKNFIKGFKAELKIN